jgi:SsrA-binding protein
MEIALCKGKKLHDKRQSIKEREAKRELNKMRF